MVLFAWGNYPIIAHNLCMIHNLQSNTRGRLFIIVAIRQLGQLYGDVSDMSGYNKEPHTTKIAIKYVHTGN